jgi:hypothetical protein
MNRTAKGQRGVSCVSFATTDDFVVSRFWARREDF